MKYILALTFISILCCCKKDGPNPRPKKVEFLDIIWKTPIVPDPDINSTIAMAPIINDDQIIFNTRSELQGSIAPVLFLDTANGSIVKTWSDYIDGTAYYSDEMAAHENNFLCLSTQRSIDCINLETQNTQWHSKVINNGPRIYTFKGYVYASIDYNNESSAAILRSPLNEEKWETVFSFTKTDRRLPYFDAMGFGQLANGDDVIVWKNRSYVYGNGTLDRTDIFAYNLTADTLLWRNMDMEINSGIIPLKVKDQRVFGLVKNHVFCMNLNSGDMIWIRDAREIVKPTLDFGFFAGDLHLTSDAVVFKGDSDEIIAVNQSNGALRYVRQDVTWGFEDRFSVYDGKLFFTGGYQFVVFDPEIGEVLYNEDLSHQFKTIRSRIVFDPIRPVMYFHNGSEAFCVKIPDLN